MMKKLKNYVEYWSDATSFFLYLWVGITDDMSGLGKKYIFRESHIRLARYFVSIPIYIGVPAFIATFFPDLIAGVGPRGLVALWLFLFVGLYPIGMLKLFEKAGLISRR